MGNEQLHPIMDDQPLNAAPRSRANIALIVAAALTAAWVVLEIQWVHGLSWDEVEFFRATRWLSQGRLPYRDYWEHHTPLQWFLFAPIARFVSGSATSAVIAMRWAQLPLWVLGGWVMARLARHVGATGSNIWTALLLLASSQSFTRWAIEYRVDTLGNVLFLVALLLALAARGRPTVWMLTGVCFSLAVLANMRLAPVVIGTGVLLLVLRLDERRWGWNPKPLWMAFGTAAVAGAFLVYTVASGTYDAMRDGLILYNVISDRLMEIGASTLLPVLTHSFRAADFGAIAILTVALFSVAVSYRSFRRPNAHALLALITVMTVVAVVRLGVQYEYHLQLTFLLLTVLAACGMQAAWSWPVAVEGRQRAYVLLAVLVIASVVSAAVAEIGNGAPALLRYQNDIMVAVDRNTAPSDRVWDGCGFALRREPAYPYWFLPAGVRLLAERRLIPAYGARELLAHPPAAIVMNLRTFYWMESFPELVGPVTHAYLPLYRNLWLPGMSARLEPKQGASWRVLHAGEYRLYASEPLAKHPWFKGPVKYTFIADERMTVPLRRLPLVSPAMLQCGVNGSLVDCQSPLHLRPGDVLAVSSHSPLPVGVLVVSPRFTELFITPNEEFFF